MIIWGMQQGPWLLQALIRCQCEGCCSWDVGNVLPEVHGTNISQDITTGSKLCQVLVLHLCTAYAWRVYFRRTNSLVLHCNIVREPVHGDTGHCCRLKSSSLARQAGIVH